MTNSYLDSMGWGTGGGYKAAEVSTPVQSASVPIVQSASVEAQTPASIPNITPTVQNTTPTHQPYTAAPVSSAKRSVSYAQDDLNNFFDMGKGFQVDDWAGGILVNNGDGSASWYNPNVEGGVQNFGRGASIQSLAGAHPEIYKEYYDTYGSNWASGLKAQNQDLMYFNPTTGLECDQYGCGPSKVQGRVDGAPSWYEVMDFNYVTDPVTGEQKLVGYNSGGGGSSGGSSYSPGSVGLPSTGVKSPTSIAQMPTGDGSITFPGIDNHAKLNNQVGGWVDQLSRGFDDFFTGYDNLVGLPDQIDQWTQDAVNRQRITSEDIVNVLSAVSNQRNAQGIMGGTESDNLGATTLANMGKIVTENQNNLLSNANSLKASAISAQPGQASIPMQALLNLYNTSANESSNWGQMAMNLLLNKF